jgi:hypothetical protein
MAFLITIYHKRRRSHHQTARCESYGDAEAFCKVGLVLSSNLFMLEIFHKYSFLLAESPLT